MENKSNYAVPIAIVLAGIIIAGAMYFNDGRPRVEPIPKVDNKTETSLDDLTPVSATDHLRGNPNAPIIFVEYSDTECPYCKRFQVTMQTIMNSYGKDGKISWVYRHFPLDNIHPKTRKEAEATECAGELGGDVSFWSYLDLIYKETPANNGLDLAKLPEFAKSVGLDVTAFNQCLTSGKYATRVQADLQGGIKIGIQGTPFGVMVLRQPLGVEAKKKITEYVATNKLYDSTGKPYVYSSADGSLIGVSGAMPVEIISGLIDIILK